MRISAIVLLACLALPAAAQVSVTLTEGTNIAAAVSPDGKQIVMDLQGTLFVLPAAGGAAKALTEPLMDARQPAWSPDNRTIVFQSFRDGGWHLWTVRSDGSALTQLTKGAADEREPQYSPDGTQIAFSSDRTGNYDVYVMPAAGGDARAITNNSGNDFGPAWSPDGKTLAFVSDREKAPGVYAVGANGAGEKLLVGDAGLAAPSWRADGQAIAFVSQGKDGSRLRSVSASGGAPTDLSAANEDVFPFRAVWNDKTLTYTADAAIKRREGATVTKIAFSAQFDLTRPTYQRKTFDFTGTGPHQIQGIKGPKVSPDGKQVVFSALGDLWVEDLDPLLIAAKKPLKARLLTHDEFLDVDPAWSPDGTQLAYVSDRSGKPEIWLRDLATKKERQLTVTPEDVAGPVWSPDSKRIAFFKVLSLNGLGMGRITVANVFTNDAFDTHSGFFAPGQLSWGPDNKTLVLNGLSPSSSRFREGLTKFVLISLTGSENREVSPLADRSMAQRGVNGPIWSPDGKSMAYVQDGVLWVVPVVDKGEKLGDIAGPPRALTTELVEAPSWSGDSKSIVYIATDRLKRVSLDGAVDDIHPGNFTWGRNIPRGQMVVWAGRLWDGVAQTYRENVDVLIDGNVITAIEPHQSGRRAALVNASTATVIPGLIESHTHMAAPFGSRFGRLWLSFGITSVREPGTDPYDALERKESWASGERPGPREFFAGALTDGARVYYGMANSVTTPAHLELEMGRAKQLGYDLIKTYVRMPDHFQKTVVSKAHEIGIPVSSHELYPAVGYGVDAVEHLRGTSRRGYSPKQSEMGASYGDVLDLLSKSGMTITPTIGLNGAFNLAVMRDPSILTMPQMTALYRDDERKAFAAAAERARPTMAALQRNVTAMQKAIREIVARGGRITAGTDSPFIPYGVSFLIELETYQAAGLTPYQVLQSATSWPATALGIDKHLGTVEPGKLADLAIIDGDPLKDVGELRKVRAVVTDGHYYLSDELLRQR